MFDIELDKGFREGAFDVAAIYYVAPHFGLEAQFVNEGKQKALASLPEELRGL